MSSAESGSAQPAQDAKSRRSPTDLRSWRGSPGGRRGRGGMVSNGLLVTVRKRISTLHKC